MYLNLRSLCSSSRLHSSTLFVVLPSTFERFHSENPVPARVLVDYSDVVSEQHSGMDRASSLSSFADLEWIENLALLVDITYPSPNHLTSTPNQPQERDGTAKGCNAYRCHQRFMAL
jgi:hypothetical protein